MGYVKIGPATVKDEQLYLSSGHLQIFPPPRLHLYTTRAEVGGSRVTNELLSWPLEGKLFWSMPAHILAANLTI